MPHLSPNLVAVLYLVSGVLFILALRGLHQPATSRRGNTLGMIGMTIAVLTTLTVSNPQQFFTWALIFGGLAVGGGIGAVHCAQDPDDADAGACRSVSLARGSRRSVRSRGRALCAGGIRYRQPWRNRTGEPGRDGSRSRHRRHHVHGLGYRLRQAFGPHVGFADHSADAACREPGAVRGAGRADLPVLHFGRQRDALLGHHGHRARLRRPPHHPHRRRRHARRRIDA